jgi:hypothetical protein
MSTSSVAIRTSRGPRSREFSLEGRISRPCFASLLASAALISSGWSAAAQEPAAPAAEAPAPGQSPEAPPAAPEADASLEVDDATGEGTPDYVEAVGVEEVVVSGFQQSLSAALGRKQRATAQLDAIVADDIADFPDLNLAEALQRIPGIAITRGSAGAAATNGEGAQITVRGLSGLYTRVRVNGMETRAAVGNNATRNFDFSIFAAELFNSVVVHKTASADLDEGSLGAVVDLNTARAFNYKEGFTAVAGATGAYNDFGEILGNDRASALGAQLHQAMEALLRVRSEAGHLYQVHDRERAGGNYEEASASLMIAYALMQGQRLGALPASAGAQGLESLRAVIREFLSPRRLDRICGVAGLGNQPYRDGSFDDYLSEPIVANDPKGVSALLMAVSEAVRRDRAAPGRVSD